MASFEREIDQPANPNLGSYYGTKAVIDRATGKQKIGPNGNRMVVDTDYTTAQIVARQAEEAAVEAARPQKWRERKYREADAEYVNRALAAIPGGNNLRQANPKDRLTALAMKMTRRNDPIADTLATVHDKLELLKDAIDNTPNTVGDVQAIDPIDDIHWI